MTKKRMEECQRLPDPKYAAVFQGRHAKFPYCKLSDGHGYINDPTILHCECVGMKGTFIELPNGRRKNICKRGYLKFDLEGQQ